MDTPCVVSIIDSKSFTILWQWFTFLLIQFASDYCVLRDVVCSCLCYNHYSDIIMGAKACQITIVYSTVYSGADQRKHQSSASLAFARGINRSLVNSPHKWLITRKMFPLMTSSCTSTSCSSYCYQFLSWDRWDEFSRRLIDHPCDLFTMHPTGPSSNIKSIFLAIGFR